MLWNCRKWKAVLVEIIVIAVFKRTMHGSEYIGILFHSCCNILCNISQLFWNIFKNLLVTSVSLHGKVLSNNTMIRMVRSYWPVHRKVFISIFFLSRRIVARNWQKNSLLDEEELLESLQEGLQKQRFINIIFLFCIFPINCDCFPSIKMRLILFHEKWWGIILLFLFSFNSCFLLLL